MDFDHNNIIDFSFSEESEELEQNSICEDEEQEESTENEVNEIDYSSILQEMNTRLENIENNTSVNYTEALNGVLANTYFLDFVGFTLFIFLMLFVVIKFFKIFF